MLRFLHRFELLLERKDQFEEAVAHDLKRVEEFAELVPPHVVELDFEFAVCHRTGDALRFGKTVREAADRPPTDRQRHDHTKERE